MNLHPSAQANSTQLSSRSPSQAQERGLNLGPNMALGMGRSRGLPQGLTHRLTGGLSAAAMALALVAFGQAASAQSAPPAPDAPTGMGAGMGAHHPGPMARLTVSGEGSATAQPDMASIMLGVSVQADTAAKAMSENATRQQSVIDKLKAEGIEARDIQTSGLNLSPVQSYSQDGKPPVITGYMAQNMVSVRVRDLGKLGAVLDMLVEAGANEINGISFTREDASEAEDAARVAAIQAAHRKADIMAEAAGMKLGRLISLSDSMIDSGPRPMMMAMGRDAKASSTPIEAGELAITANVTATYALIAAKDEGQPEGLAPNEDPPAPN